MKTELERFHETVGILVKAYLNDTLAHKSCTACAVGNIISYKNGYTIIEDKENTLIGMDCMNWQQNHARWWGELETFRAYGHATDTQTQTTGYTLGEISLI